MVLGRMISSVIAMISACLIASSPDLTASASEIKSNELIKIDTRPGVKQKFILMKSMDPTASVILLDGGPGKLNLSSLSGKPSVGNKNVSFLIEKRDAFAKKGFITATMDAPSDQQSRKGMELEFRISNEHAQDIKAVADYLRSHFDVPVWVLGISASSLSVPNAAIRIKEGLDGIVLLSSGTKMRRQWTIFKSHPNGVLDMELDKIIVPTLIIAHKDDKCDLTPPDGAQKIKDLLTNSPRAKVLYFTGGAKPGSKACREKSPHGFYGIEEEVITAIADFIITNSN